MTKSSKTSIMTLVTALFEKETPLYIKGTVALALAYTVFPIDVLPDVLGPLGLVDDAAVIGVLTTIAMALLNNYYEKQTEAFQTDPNQPIKMANVVEK